MISLKLSYGLRRVIVALILAACGTKPSSAAVNLIIDNQSGSEIWLQWTGMPSLTGTATTATGSISIAPSDFGVNAAGYQLSSFQSFDTNKYLITNYSQQGGRLWFTEGSSGFTFHNTGYTPALANFNDANFTKRYDKIEASITGSTDDNMNMTSLDGFSIPFRVVGYKSTAMATTTQTLSGSPTNQILSALGALAANPSAPAPAGGYPKVTSYSPYLVINSNSVNTSATPVGSTGNFVRVIANDQIVAAQGGDPVVAANGGNIPANYLYKDYAIYLKKMDGTGTNTYSGVTSMSGLFSGLGAGATDQWQVKQNYSLTTTFSATEQMTMLNAQGVLTTYTGVITHTGTVSVVSGTASGTLSGVTTNVIIKTPYQEVLAVTGVVGANAGYSYSTDGGVTWHDTGAAGPQNNVFTWINGDLLAGMNVGTIGSEKLFTGTINGNTYTNARVGEIASQDMFSLGKVLADSLGGVVYDYYYGYLQDSTDYYNDYAAALYKLTDAYGFAYGERIEGGSVAVSWDATQTETAIDTLVITILPDTVPEPSTTALVLATVGGLLLGARRRRLAS